MQSIDCPVCLSHVPDDTQDVIAFSPDKARFEVSLLPAYLKRVFHHLRFVLAVEPPDAIHNLFGQFGGQNVAYVFSQERVGRHQQSAWIASMVVEINAVLCM